MSIRAIPPDDMGIIDRTCRTFGSFADFLRIVYHNCRTQIYRNEESDVNPRRYFAGTFYGLGWGGYNGWRYDAAKTASADHVRIEPYFAPPSAKKQTLENIVAPGKVEAFRGAYDRFIDNIEKGVAVPEYEAQCRELAKKCGFPTEQLEEAVRAGSRRAYKFHRKRAGKVSGEDKSKASDLKDTVIYGSEFSFSQSLKRRHIPFLLSRCFCTLGSGRMPGTRHKRSF